MEVVGLRVSTYLGRRRRASSEFGLWTVLGICVCFFLDLRKRRVGTHNRSWWHIHDSYAASSLSIEGFGEGDGLK